MRKILLFTLMAMMFVVMGVGDPYHYEVTYPYDAINPDTNEFPGGRGANQMIVYTPDFGERTGTNEWGIEVIVRNGRIISIGENDNPIPSDGMVLSGHGEAHNWINRYLESGMSVKIDRENQLIQAVLDSKTILEGALIETEEMRSFRDEHKNAYTFRERWAQNRQYRRINRAITRAQSLLEEENTEEIKEAVQEAEQAVERGWFLTMISEREEMRGIWERLPSMDAEELTAYLDEVESHGFNALFPEVFYWGRSLYPGEIIKQFEAFQGYDPLELMIEEGKKRNIEIHAWVENIYVGLEDSPLVQQHPEWLTMTRDGRNYTYHDEFQVYYMSWAIPEVRELLISYYREMVKNYPGLAGLNLDYIRWPTQDAAREFGFSPLEREIFKEKHGFDQMDIEPGDKEKQQIFNEWKEGLISDFVERVYRELKEINPDLLISAAVATPLEDARKTKQQNWAQWSRANNLDILTPMIYTLQSEAVYREMNEIREEINDTIPVVAGLGTYQGTTPMTVWRQVHQARQSGSPGFVIFDWSNSDEEQLRVFKKGIHRNSARVPKLW